MASLLVDNNSSKQTPPPKKKKAKGVSISVTRVRAATVALKKGEATSTAEAAEASGTTLGNFYNDISKVKTVDLDLYDQWVDAKTEHCEGARKQPESEPEEEDLDEDVEEITDEELAEFSGNEVSVTITGSVDAVAEFMGRVGA